MRQTYFAKLHPALCFGFFAAVLCLTVVVQHPAYLAVSLLAGVCLNVSLSGLRALKRFARLVPLWAVLAGINPILNPRGAQVLFTYLGRPYTWEALCYGMAVAGMFLAMLQWFSAYNAVMTEDKFVYLFARLAPATALLLTTVLRMIPNLVRRAAQITGARQGVGLGGAGKGLRDKIQSGISVLSVLTTWALEGGEVTADSMNSRGYGASRRTSFYAYAWKAADRALAGAGALLLAAVLTALIRGGGRAEYTPAMTIAPVTGMNLAYLAAYLLLLMGPSLLNLKEDIQWRISRSKI